MLLISVSDLNGLNRLCHFGSIRPLVPNATIGWAQMRVRKHFPLRSQAVGKSKWILVFICLSAFVTTASAVGPGDSPIVSSPRSVAVPVPSTEALAANLREWLIQELPDPLFADEPGWGRTASVATGVKWKGKGLHVHPEVMRQD